LTATLNRGPGMARYRQAYSGSGQSRLDVFICTGGKFVKHYLKIVIRRIILSKINFVIAMHEV
jgi:hypothetical protein